MTTLRTLTGRPIHKVYFAVVGKNRLGEKVYYTGRAGDGWLSPNAAEAFDGYSEVGAQAAAERHNHWTAVHGVTFTTEKVKV